jgi:uncharacterized protein (DUF1015 family)
MPRPVRCLLTYKAVPEIDCARFTQITAAEPGDRFHRARTACDTVRGRFRETRRHRVSLIAEFAKMPALYIADGHHRSAAAGRIYQSRGGAGGSYGIPDRDLSRTIR